MIKIQFLVLDDLDDNASEIFDAGDLHDPAMDKWWIDWVTCESYEDIAHEFVMAVNNDEIDDINCYYRIKESE